MANYYTVSPDQAGKSLNDLRNESNAAFRPDVLASFAGINENTPLTAGQVLAVNLPENYRNSGEAQGLQKLFGSGQSEEDYQTQRAMKLFQDANAPLTQQYKSELGAIPGQTATTKKSIIDRYKSLLDELTQREQQDTQVSQTNLAREYAKRGIPLSSGDYSVAQTETTKPIGQYYTAQRGVTVANEGQELNQQDQIQANKENSINELLATIQSGASKDAINFALQKVQNAQAQAQQAIQNNFTQQGLDLQKQSQTFSQAQANKPQQQFITSGGRNLLVSYDSNGNVVNKVDLGATGTGSNATTKAAQTQQYAQDVLNKAAGGATLSDLQKDYGAKLGSDTVVQLYSSSTKYGPPTESYAQKILGITGGTPSASDQTKQQIESYKALGFSDEEAKQLVIANSL